MNSYQFVVVDDEALQRKIFTEIIQKICPEAHIIQCHNGQEALAAIQAQKSHVLITDIRMPIMDGLELLEVVARDWPKVLVVMISAYQEFSYAKKAIEHGAFDYILKPFRINEIESLLEKIISELKIIKEQDHLQRHYTKAIRHIEIEQFGIELADYLDHDHSGVISESLLKGLPKSGAMGLISFSSRQGNIRHISNENKLIDELLAVTDEVFPNIEYFDGRFIQSSQDDLLGFILTKEEAKDTVRQLFLIKDRLAVRGIKASIGLSQIKNDLLAELPCAVSESKEAWSYHFYEEDKSGVYLYEDIMMQQHGDASILSKLEEHELLRAVKLEDTKRIDRWLERFCSMYRKEKLVSPRVLKNRLASVVFMSVQEFESRHPRPTYDDLMHDTYYRLLYAESYHELVSLAEQTLKHGVRFADEAKESGDPIEQVIGYIDTHFNEDLALQDLATRVGYTPAHLSTLIKEKTGLSFMNYLTTLRLNNATTLLKETDLSVFEVAGRSGYRDSGYFSRHFNSRYGCSPETYRKMNFRRIE